MRRTCPALFAFAFAFAFASAAPAQTANVEAEKPASETSSRSDDVRAGKRFNAGARAGIMYTVVPGAGVEGNLILDKRFQVGGSINHGALSARAESNNGSNEVNSRNDEGDDKTNLDKADIRVTSVESHLKWFPLNSLYVTGGGSVRAVRSEVQISDDANSANYVNTQTEARAVCVDVGVGNEWSWNSGFFLGAEWVGLSTAILSKSTTKNDKEGAPNDQVENDAKGSRRFAESIGKGTSVRLAMLHAGWAF